MRSPLERVLVRCKSDANGCWVFTGAKSRGYGVVRISRAAGNKVTHRVVYETLVGDVPEGLDLDHLCRNRACCNPSHLEPVTRSENLRRSPLVGKRRVVKTHCPQGHPYDESNTYVTPSGGRMCRTCTSRPNRRRRAEANAAIDSLEDLLSQQGSVEEEQASE